MKNHPLEGAKLTAPLVGLARDRGQRRSPSTMRNTTAPGIPLGLAGDAISLGGRIVAVAGLLRHR